MLTRKQFCALTLTSDDQLKNLIRRDLAPYLDDLAVDREVKSTVTATKDKHGWRRYSGFDALTLAIMNDFARAGGVSLDLAKSLSGNACMKLHELWPSLASKDPRKQIWVGAVGYDAGKDPSTNQQWYGGYHVAGTLTKVTTEILFRQAENRAKESAEAPDYRLLLVNASSAFQAICARAEELALELSPEADYATWRQVKDR